MAGMLVLVVVTKVSTYLVYGKIDVQCFSSGFEYTFYSENVALNKNTLATPSFITWPAGQAVDGDSDVNGGSRTCYHALSSPSFWTVDLGWDYQLYDIKVYLRAGYLYRTANSAIYLDNDPSRLCFTFPSTFFNNPTNVTCNDTARYVIIRNPGYGPNENDALNICEVVINGCSSGTYGVTCLNICNCAYCNRWSGICYTDCYPGWTGKRCDLECYDTYGINCLKRCADRACKNHSSSCDHLTGSCDSSGCRPGWKDDACHEKCDESHYGIGCSNMCSARKCFGNSSCDYVTGSCDYGCEAGWRSPDCTQACDSEHYGQGCTGMCTTRNCLGTSTCNSTTGQCDGGCQTGWTGIDCSECGDKYYGSDCSSRCADRHCDGISVCYHVTGSCDMGCQTGWKGLDCAQACHREHYGPDCTGVCASRHCEGGSSCKSTSGICDQGCQSGWKGKDCIVNTAAGGDSTPLIVGTVVGVVLLVIIIILVIFLSRRRKNMDTSDTNFNNAPSQSVKVQDQGSRVMEIHTISVGGYDTLDVMSLDQGNTDSTYTMIDSFDNDGRCGKVTEDASDVLSDVTFGDASERKVDTTYDNLDKTSLNQYGDYTRIEKSDSYENVKIPNK